MEDPRSEMWETKGKMIGNIQKYINFVNCRNINNGLLYKNNAAK